MSMTFARDFNHPMWALLYLHDWDPKREDGSRPVYPEIHGLYADERTAIDNLRAMNDPSKYWLVKAYPITRKEHQS